MVAWIDTVWWRWLSRIWLLFSRKIRWNQRGGDGKIDIIGIIKIVRSLIRQEEKSGSRWNNGSISRIHRGSGEKEDEKWRIEKGRLRLESKVFHRTVWLPGITYFSPCVSYFFPKGVGFPGEPVTSTFPNFHSNVLKELSSNWLDEISRTFLEPPPSLFQIEFNNENVFPPPPFSILIFALLNIINKFSFLPSSRWTNCPRSSQLSEFRRGRGSKCKMLSSACLARDHELENVSGSFVNLLKRWKVARRIMQPFFLSGLF